MASADLRHRLLAAELALAAGDIDRSRSEAEHVETLARQRADKLSLGWALLLRARSHHLQAQYGAAYSAAFEASALLRANGDIARALRAQNTLVAVHCENQDLMRAAEQARIGIDMAVAHREHEMTVRLLHSLARVLHSGGDFPEAIRCLQQALALHAQRPEVLANHQQRCATELAWARLNYGEQLALQGQQQESEVQLRAAKDELPAHATVQAGDALDAIAYLAQRVHLQAVWQQRQGARCSAAALFKLVRRHGPPHQLAVALHALGTLHLCAGQPRRAICQQLRCLGVLEQMDFSAAVHSTKQRLADLCARTGAYGAALLWQHEAVVARAQARREQAVLRARVAQLERQAARRHSLAHELLEQGQRTLVLGRLIGHLNHALAEPAKLAHQHIEQTQFASQNHADAVGVLVPLQHALRQIDLAAALAQQLKLFSFRATPQGNVLLLEEALQTAWEGLRLYCPLLGWSLGMVEPTRSQSPLEARADPQRLGILLKALLIGMTQPQVLSAHAQQAGGQVLWAQVSCAQSGEISLSLGVSGHHGLSTGDGDAYALCVELAHEMGGQLSVEMDGTLMRCHRLMLPRASSTLNAPSAEPVWGAAPVTTKASELQPNSQPNLRALALATLEEAKNLSEQGQHLAAQPLAQRAVGLARECADLPLLGAALTLLCQAEYRLGRQVQAFAVAGEAYQLLSAIGDLSRQAHVLSVRAMIEWNSGNGARAIGLWRKGLLAIQAARAEGQSTDDIDTATSEHSILHHLAGWLSRSAEHPGAIQYAKAAVAVWQGQPQHAHRLQSAAALLAGVHADYADDLRLKGRHAEAEHQAQCAALALMPLDPQTWRSLDYLGLTTLCQQSYVQSFLRDWPGARASTVAILRAARRGTLGPAWYAMSIETLGQLHWYAGRMGRAGVYWQRSAQKYREAGMLAHPLAIFDRRIEAQAALGAFDAAVALQKEHRALRTELHLQATALRVQIDMIERQNERRRRQASDALLHGQRLAVMGRLIAQTHHALHSPVASALALTAAAAALACAVGGSNDARRSDSHQRELTQLMQHLVQRVDGAARLVNQLKLFTYRSSPEPTASLLREVLRNEWQAIAQHGSLGEVTLEIQDSPTVHAWADVQRLCILLRVLLIELTQTAGLAKLSARIEATDDGNVLLHLMAGFDLPLAGTLPSLGLTLCQEIAVEMGGRLQIDQTATALQTRLRLPDAGQRRQLMAGGIAFQ